jgi:hypothetical protein
MVGLLTYFVGVPNNTLAKHMRSLYLAIKENKKFLFASNALRGGCSLPA